VKPVRLTPAARQDRRDEVLHYRTEAGARVARKLVDAMKKALQALEQRPGMGSPDIGQELDIDGLRAWRPDGFPRSLWYFERAAHVLVVRWLGSDRTPSTSQSWSTEPDNWSFSPGERQAPSRNRLRES
jgi:toxin ParE1/3/4